MATKKTSKKATPKETCFYLYKWTNGFTTFVVADSPEDALEKIRKAKDSACPPEVRNERLSKKRLASTSTDFILTVSSNRIDDDQEYMDDEPVETPKKDLN